MRRELAEEIVREVLAASGNLDGLLATLQGSMDEQTFLGCRRLTGQIMGVLYIEILRDICQQYPDLEPESMQSGGTILSPGEATGAVIRSARQSI